MKKFIVFAAALLVSVASFAQETNKDADGNYQYGPYETNKFFDNWFVGVGGGVNVAIDDVFGKIKGDADNIKWGGYALALDAYLGKWFDPCFGARLGWTGWNYNAPTLTSFGDMAFGEYDGETTGFADFEEYKVPGYNAVHADLLWNISNQFWGYKENRFFNLSPYASVAWAWTRKGYSPGLGFGFLNQFRFSEHVGAFLDLRATGYSDSIYKSAKDVDNGIAGMITASLGLNFNLGKANWTRKSTTIASYVAAVAAAEAAAAAAKAEADAAKNKYATDNDAIKALQDENEALKKQLANAGQGTSGDLFDEPMVAYFNIGKSTLTTTEAERVKNAAKQILNNGDNVKFTLTGHADANTGTQAINEKLAAERAQAVYDLMQECGVSADKFTVSSEVGGPFDADELNRCVIVEKQ